MSREDIEYDESRLDPVCPHCEKVVVPHYIRIHHLPMCEEMQSLKSEVEGLRAGTYHRGNSVGYIYDKMACYREQVFTAYDALRMLGWSDKGTNGNVERRESILAWAARTEESLRRGSSLL